MPIQVQLTLSTARDLKGLSDPNSTIVAKISLGHGGEKSTTSAQAAPYSWNHACTLASSGDGPAEVVLKVTLFETKTNQCIGITKVECDQRQLAKLKQLVWYPLHERITTKDPTVTAMTATTGLKGQICLQIDDISTVIKTAQVSALNPSRKTNINFDFLQSVGVCTRAVQEVVNAILYADPVVGLLAGAGAWMAASSSSLFHYCVLGMGVFNLLRFARVVRSTAPDVHHPRFLYPTDAPVVLQRLSRFNCLVGDVTKVAEAQQLFQELTWSLKGYKWGRLPIVGIALSILLMLFQTETIAKWGVLYLFGYLPCQYYLRGTFSSMMALLSFQPAKVQASLSTLIEVVRRRRPLVVEGTELMPPQQSICQEVPTSTPMKEKLAPIPVIYKLQSKTESSPDSGDAFESLEDSRELEALLKKSMAGLPRDFELQSAEGILKSALRNLKTKDPDRALTCIFLNFKTSRQKQDVLNLLIPFCDHLTQAGKLDMALENAETKHALFVDAFEFSLALGKNLTQAKRYVMLRSRVKDSGALEHLSQMSVTGLDMQERYKSDDFLKEEFCITQNYLSPVELAEIEREVSSCAVMAPPKYDHSRGIENTLCVAAVCLQVMQSTIPIVYSSKASPFFAVLVYVAPGPTLKAPCSMDVARWGPEWREHKNYFCPPKLHQSLRSQWDVGTESKMTLDYFNLLLMQFYHKNKHKRRPTLQETDGGGTVTPTKNAPISPTTNGPLARLRNAFTEGKLSKSGGGGPSPLEPKSPKSPKVVPSLRMAGVRKEATSGGGGAGKAFSERRRSHHADVVEPTTPTTTLLGPIAKSARFYPAGTGK